MAMPSSAVSSETPRRTMVTEAENGAAGSTSSANGSERRLRKYGTR